MHTFTLRPLVGAILGVTATSIVAQTTQEAAPTTTHQLSTIVVSASGFEQELKNAPASISVVTKEDIEKKNATSIADLLVDVPGIDIRDGVGKTAGLNIKMRGLGNDYSLILIDGRRQTTSSDVTPNGFGESSNAYLPPLSSIERIEVIRGPMATRYGSEAMGGVINIITKKVSDEWNGNVTVSGNAMEHSGEADSWKTSVVLNGPLITDRLGMQLRGSYLDRQRSERVPGSTGRDPRPNKADNYDFGGKLSFQLDDQNALWLDGFHSAQRYSNEDNRLGTIDLPSKANGYKDELEFNRTQISVGHDGDYSFGQWKTYASHTTTETVGRTIPSKTFPNNAHEGKDRTLENTDLVIDSHIVMPFTNHTVTAGAEYKDATVADDIAGIGQEFSKDSWSLYAEDEWALRDDLRLTLGGRYEDHSGFGGQFSPRAYLVWNTNDILTLKGGVSTGYKVPSPKALHDGIINYSGQGETPTLGNSALKPETSINYELGFNFQPNDQLNLTATAFFNQIEDKIMSSRFKCPESTLCSGLASSVKEYTQSANADEAETKGLEISLNYSVLPEWDIKTAYTLMETEVTKGKNKGAYFSNVPKHALNTTSTWHINPALDIWLQHEYRSNKDRFQTQPESPTSGLGSSDYQESLIFGDKFAGYNIFNLGASYTINDQLRVNMAVNNLLDKDFTKDNQTYEYDSTDKNGNPITSNATAYKYLDIGSGMSGTYLAGRNYWLSVSYDF